MTEYDITFRNLIDRYNQNTEQIKQMTGCLEELYRTNENQFQQDHLDDETAAMFLNAFELALYIRTQSVEIIEQITKLMAHVSDEDLLRQSKKALDANVVASESLNILLLGHM